MDEKKLDDAIERMADLTRASNEPDKCLKFSQAGLNIAQIKVIISKGSTTKRASAS